MNLSQLSVRRPIFTTMVALIVVVLGLASLQRLRIDLLPAIEQPTLSVSTSYEGADPEVVERLVTQIVEEVISTVPGVIELRSSSSEGRSRVTVSFAWGTEIDVAASDVRARLEEELSELPDDVDRPQIRKFDISSFPVVLLGVASDSLNPIELTDVVERQIRYRFARLEGVAQVDLWGGFDREIRIALQPDRVRALGLSLPKVIEAIRNANLDLPAGEIDGGRFEVTLRAPSEFQSLDEVRDLVIDVRAEAAVTLGQVATVEDTYAKLNRHIRVDGERAIRVAIRKQADANTVEVARRILAEIERANRDLPHIHVVPVINQGNFIERSIANVANSVLYGGALAVIILLFFLRNLRSTVVISLSIPLSIMATFALVYAGGLTINLMTLGGLALGVGMMVDNAIVVLENIYRRRDEEHESPTTAAVRGTGEVAGAIIASTITTLVIFLPMVFVEGVTGLLFRDLALVVVFSLIASLAVALTLVPMLASRLLKAPKGASAPRLMSVLSSGAGVFFDAIDDLYRDLLRWVLRWRITTLGVIALGFAASLALWPMIGSEFMPPSDEGEISVTAEFDTGTRLEVADQQSRIIEQAVADSVPEVRSALTSVTASGRRGGAATATVNISVGPVAERERSNDAIATELREQLTSAVPGASVRVRAKKGQFLLEHLLGSGDGLSVELRGYDLATLERLHNRMLRVLGMVPGISKINDGLPDITPQEHLTIDRAKVADLGLSVRDVGRLLELGVSGGHAGDYRPDGYSIPIRIQLADVETIGLDRILDQTLVTPVGEAVMLRNLVTHAPGVGPTVINRKDQRRTLTIDVDVDGRDMGSVAQDVQFALGMVPMPDGYQAEITGSWEEQQEATNELTISFILALLLVYMVLACQYESLRDPLIVMLAVPVAAIGVLLTLYITRSTMNVQSGIGCIMLGGIVVNNAILLVDQTSRLRATGSSVFDAVAEAGRRRLRPILMTTATTVLGLLPLAFGIGEGADAQAPLARAVVGGLIGSTLITLVLIPIVYTLVHPERPSSRGE